MSTFQIRDLPAKAPLDGSELIELQEAAGGAGSSKQAPTGAFLPPDYISGLKMVWGSANSLSVTSGAAFISSLGRVLRSTSTLTLSGLALTASTWYHVYLYNNGGTPAIECVTTAPAAAYYGTARAKTGDTSRRYVGSIKTDSSGSIYNFNHVGNVIAYKNFQASLPFRVLANGTATTETLVDLSAVIPLTSTLANIRAINTSTSTGFLLGTSDDSVTMDAFHSVAAVDASANAFLPMPTDTVQKITYMLAASSTNGGYIDIYGYTYER